MTKFRPCIDLHAGSVKQIVGGTLSTDNANLKTNFTSEHPAAYFAELYQKHGLTGGHVIMLGPGNDEAAGQALSAWPHGLQVGGGIKDVNAKAWIDAGAERSVLEALGGDKNRLVIDLSCRKVGDGWRVAMDKWQTITEFEINKDAEGLQAGIDERLVTLLGQICSIPVTYAGGGRHIQDLELVERLSGGKIDLTIGSALDIFGGKNVTFEECCEWNRGRG
nr:1-(5-phosphoribosyl)-5-[(5-phosphoribosylamino)methylideneamino] imidazole-4-carboxamide isomerase [Quercus suber]